MSKKLINASGVKKNKSMKESWNITLGLGIIGGLAAKYWLAQTKFTTEDNCVYEIYEDDKCGTEVS